MLTVSPADDSKAPRDGTLRDMNVKVRVVAICLALSALAGLVLLVVRPSVNPAHVRPLPLIALAWMAFLTAAWLLRKVPVRTAVVLILLGGIGMQIAAMSAPPRLSDDLYRYIWDGRVQAAGINPYAHVPAAPELALLRDSAIWPLINRADYAVTIYPPVAQALFLGITRLGETVVVMKLGLLLFEGVTVAAIIALIRRLGISPARIAAYAWHPLPVWEIAGNGHVDAAMIALLMMSLLVFLNGRSLLA